MIWPKPMLSETVASAAAATPTRLAKTAATKLAIWTFGFRGGSLDEASGCAHGEAQAGEIRCDKQVRPEPVLKPL